jgi:hypothetical protein
MADIQRWEYLWVRVDEKWWETEDEWRPVEASLNRFGLYGWEVVGVCGPALREPVSVYEPSFPRSDQAMARERREKEQGRPFSWALLKRPTERKPETRLSAGLFESVSQPGGLRFPLS